MQRTRRVVVTGIGIISPIGCNVKTAWNNLINGECGIKKLIDPAYEKLPCTIAAQIPDSMLDVGQHFSKSELKAMSKSTSYALIAAKEALENANWLPEKQVEKDRTGVAIGIGMVDLADISETSDLLKKGYNRVSPFFVPRILPNMAAGQISIKYGFRGPNHSVSTACATGAHSIGDAFRFISHNDADIMICGGAEACISPLSIAGFCRLRALSSSSNENPTKASRPFDKDRDGFIMGEGSAILVLEELKHAQKRGANIIAEILGYGLSGDASHLTAPSEDGQGAQLAMQRAINDARLALTDITFINAHATSTPIGDAVEVKAIKNLFQSHSTNIFITSTKGAHGHLLGAAGNLEAAFTALACQTGIIPPTINLNNITEEMKMNFVANKNTEWIKKSENMRRIALKNAFGFGGTNSSICIAEFKQ